MTTTTGTGTATSAAPPEAASPASGQAAAGHRLRPLWPLALLWLAVGTLLQVLRQPEVAAWDSLWAEDGGIFLTPALNDPFLQSVATPYNGYLHLAPRLLAEVVAPFPLVAAAVLVATLSALTVTLLSIYVYWASGAVLRSGWARVLVVVLMALGAAAGIESSNNLNNLHWFLMFASFWACVAPPRGRRGAVLGALVVAVSALTDPMTALVLPLALLQVARVAGWRPANLRRASALWAALVPAALLATLAVQFFVAGTSPGRYTPSSWADLPGIYGFRVVGSLVVGERHIALVPAGAAAALGYLLLVLALAGLVVAFVVGDRPARYLLLAAAAYSWIFFTVPLMLRGTTWFMNEPGHQLGGSRYIVIPALLLAVALVAGMDRRAATRPAAWSWPQVLATVVVGTVLVLNYANAPLRTLGPAWRVEHQAATAVCRGPSPPDRIWIPVAPVAPRGTSSVAVSCDRLTGDG